MKRGVTVAEDLWQKNQSQRPLPKSLGQNKGHLSQSRHKYLKYDSKSIRSPLLYP